MAESATRTLVCSVALFDIAGYSRRPIAEQQQLKQTFNEVLAHALEGVPPRDVIVLDTGDGAAVAFTGNPEDALFVSVAFRDALAERPAGGLAARIGVNLGPVRLVWDLNAQMNVLGDGINAAQRVMGFAEPGEVLVSRSFFEVMSRLSGHFAALFRPVGARRDKHGEEHVLYAIADGVVAERRSRRREAEPGAAPAPEDPAERAEVFDAGSSLMVSGRSRSAVQAALEALAARGARLVSPITQVGDKWLASCEHPRAALGACRVEEVGYRRVVSAPTREAVAQKVRELVAFGAVLLGEIERTDEGWMAVCDTAGPRR